MIDSRYYTTIMSRKLSESRVGEFSIKRDVMPARAMTRMYTPAGFFYNDMFRKSFPVVKLREEGGGIWMSDTPMEQDALRMTTLLAYGDVLIIGLGLGLLPTLIRMKNRAHRVVKHITIVEKEKDIAELVYDKIKWAKTSLAVNEGKEFLKYCRDNNEKFDFIYIDVWAGIIAPIREADEWVELAKPCLTENGSVRYWLQELHERVRNKLPKEPTQKTGQAAVHEPCLICGKKLRFDYAGLCMDCADLLEVSEAFVKEKP